MEILEIMKIILTEESKKKYSSFNNFEIPEFGYRESMALTNCIFVASFSLSQWDRSSNIVLSLMT